MSIANALIGISRGMREYEDTLRSRRAANLEALRTYMQLNPNASAADFMAYRDSLAGSSLDAHSAMPDSLIQGMVEEAERRRAQQDQERALADLQYQTNLRRLLEASIEPFLTNDMDDAAAFAAARSSLPESLRSDFDNIYGSTFGERRRAIREREAMSALTTHLQTFGLTLADLKPTDPLIQNLPTQQRTAILQAQQRQIEDRHRAQEAQRRQQTLLATNAILQDPSVATILADRNLSDTQVVAELQRFVDHYNQAYDANIDIKTLMQRRELSIGSQTREVNAAATQAFAESPAAQRILTDPSLSDAQARMELANLAKAWPGASIDIDGLMAGRAVRVREATGARYGAYYAEITDRAEAQVAALEDSNTAAVAGANSAPYAGAIRAALSHRGLDITEDAVDEIFSIASGIISAKKYLPLSSVIDLVVAAKADLGRLGIPITTTLLREHALTLLERSDLPKKREEAIERYIAEYNPISGEPVDVFSLRDDLDTLTQVAAKVEQDYKADIPVSWEVIDKLQELRSDIIGAARDIGRGLRIGAPGSHGDKELREMVQRIDALLTRLEPLAAEAQAAAATPPERPAPDPDAPIGAPPVEGSIFPPHTHSALEAISEERAQAAAAEEERAASEQRVAQARDYAVSTALLAMIERHKEGGALSREEINRIVTGAIQDSGVEMDSDLVYRDLNAALRYFQLPRDMFPAVDQLIDDMLDQGKTPTASDIAIEMLPF